ncbi:MAG: hypothetical protein AAF845_04800 [Bacteroidota bacterium]
MRSCVLVLLLLLTASGCGGPPGDQGLVHRISSRVESGAVVDLADLAPFVWPRVHVFEPYTTEADAEQQMGVAWPDEWPWSAVETLDDRTFLVFVRDSAIVSAFDYLRVDGDFASEPLDAPDGLSPEAARFDVLFKGDGSAALVPEAVTPSESEE